METRTEAPEQVTDRVAGLKLDDLIDCSREDLDELFLAAGTPSIREVQGVTRGRVLAGRFWLCCRLGRWLTNLPWMLWKGKVFESVTESMGQGINRLELGPIKTRFFRFEARIVPPLTGPNDVLTLNYNLPGNRWPIRVIRDDLKKLREGLFLGTANFQWKGKHHFVLYFGLEVTGSSSGIGV
ncbi:MAG: hypothetical protein HYU36_23910 [Planctomycetes bacterium]|nr:hypothetical protein [Planctomycetota bacterium]